MAKISPGQVLGLSALHLIVTMVVLFFALGGFSEAMDDPNWTRSLVGRIADVLVQILAAPMMLVWVGLELGHKSPDSLEWTFFLFNSVIWGVGLAYLRAWLLGRRDA